MRTKIEEETFRKAFERNGEAHQLIVLFEEMSELQKEVCKAIRFNRRQLKETITEEIADVEICLEQLKLIMEIDDGEVEAWRLSKIVRLRERLHLIPNFLPDPEPRGERGDRS